MPRFRQVSPLSTLSLKGLGVFVDQFLKRVIKDSVSDNDDVILDYVDACVDHLRELFYSCLPVSHYQSLSEEILSVLSRAVQRTRAIFRAKGEVSFIFPENNAHDLYVIVR